MCPRPQELDDALREKTDEIDARILDALTQFENPKKGFKMKSTQTNVAKLSGCSLGAVRSRKWALARIDRIKDARKKTVSKRNNINTNENKTDNLRDRVVSLLKQNAILYDEIIGLREDVARLMIENKKLVKNANVDHSNGNVVSISKKGKNQ